MKRILLAIFMCIAAANTLFAAHSYTSTSVLSAGTFVKIRVSESGLHALTFDELKSMGLDPQTVRLYGYGGAMLPQSFALPHTDDLPLVPVFLDKGADNVFNSGDRLIFYAQGPISWSFNGTRFFHTRNPYSDYGYYFLTSGQGPTEEIATLPSPATSDATPVTSFIDYRLHEKELINLIDRSGIEGGGREFYGEQFTPGTSLSFPFQFSGLRTEANSFRWFVSLASHSQLNSTFDIQMDAQKASVTCASISTSDFYTRASTTTSNKAFTPDAQADKTLRITFRNSSNGAVGFLNYIELNATCDLALRGNEPLYFRTSVGYGSSTPLEYRISGTTAATQVWDITDRTHIQRVSSAFSASSGSTGSNATGTTSFLAQNTTIREYVAFNPSAARYASPVSMGKIAPQNLHALSDIDLVIITPEEFLSEAQRLGNAHAEHDNMTVAVVTDQQVYNEFSSGTPDATAYRWLMKMLYDRAGGSATSPSSSPISAPRYLLLFGDGTFDNRKLLPASGNNKLLTYQAENSVSEVRAYASDDYFAFLDDNEGTSDATSTMDIGVGRLPVNTQAEATAVVGKLIRHIEGGTPGKWKSQLVFLADDGDSNLHTSCADQAGERTRKNNPDFVVNKIYLDAYTQEVNASGESYPLAQMQLNNLLNTGALLFDYCGHSGYNNASSEGLVTLAGVRAMQNANPAFWLFASCSFALFDAGRACVAEEAVLNPDGGAIAVCSASRTVYASQNAILNRNICDALMEHSTPFGYHNRLGDAVRLGKNACGNDENKLSFVLLGDPAISLHFPTTYQVRTTTIADTLNALSVAQVEGYIEAEDGSVASWFNGQLHISVYDKMQRITTLDNDQSDASEKVKYTYNDYPNILFQGETTVTDGRFSYTFMVPKDIRYNYGTGRIVYYAQDASTGEEGVGHYEDFVVGGSSPVLIQDSIGPELTIYLGSSAFQSGDKTSETPHFFAEIADDHGINTVGSGIGHDLLLIVDGKPSETYVLNNFFTATSNSYQQGLVSYQMAELAEGPHSLFFRAWDLVNNSSTATLQFEVVKGFDPSITTLITYPNPAVSGSVVNFFFECNQPDILMQTDIFIYDVSGRLVHSISQRGTEAVRWNLADTATPPGIYLYKVQLSSSQTKTCSQSGKIIITQ